MGAEVLLEITEIVYDVYFLARGLVHGLVDGDTTICAIYESGDHFADVEAWADDHAMMTYEAYAAVSRSFWIVRRV